MRTKALTARFAAQTHVPTARLIQPWYPRAAKRPIVGILLALALGGGSLKAEVTQPATRAEAPWTSPRVALEALEPEYVPPSYEALKVNGQTIQTSWKRLTVNPWGLPSFVLKDQQVVKPESSFDMEVNGRQQTLAPQKQTITQRGKGRVDVETLLKGQDCDVMLALSVEFDFLVKARLEVSAPREVTVSRLALDVSLPNDMVDLYTCQEEQPNHPLSGLEAEHLRQFGSVDKQAGLSRKFCHWLWLGNTLCGISVQFDSARNWTPDGTDALHYSPQDGRLRIAFISEPFALKQKTAFTFSLEPTPIRDMPSNWRCWNFTVRTGYEEKVRDDVNLLNEWDSLYRLSDGYWLGVRNPDKLKQLMSADHRKPGRLVLPYIIGTELSYDIQGTLDGKAYYYENEQLKALAEHVRAEPSDFQVKPPPAACQRLRTIDEWNAVWKGRYATGSFANSVVATQTPEMGDFMAYEVNQWLSNYDADGFYIDGASPYSDFRVVKGDENRGFVDAKGRARPIFAVSQMRDNMKRLLYLVKKKDPRNVMLGHISGVKPAPLMGLYDIHLIGETFFYWYMEPGKRDASPNGDYYYAYIFGDIDNLRTQLYWRQWGAPILFLPELRGRDGKMFSDPRKGTQTMLAYVLHFDMLIWPDWCDEDAVYAWWKIREEYGMQDDNEKQVEFVPYWENTLIKASNPSVKVSYYQKVYPQDPYISKPVQKDLLVIASNLQFGKALTALQLAKDLAGSKVTDAQNHRALSVAEDGTVTRALDGYDFAILRVQAPAQ